MTKAKQPPRAKGQTVAASRKKQIIVARLRGASYDQCAAISGVQKSYCSKILNAYIAQVEAGIIEGIGEDTDPVLRWQIARAEKQEIEVQQLKGKLMNVAIVMEQCQRIAKHLRGAQKQLDKSWGVEAGNIVREAIKAAEREEKRLVK